MPSHPSVTTMVITHWDRVESQLPPGRWPHVRTLFVNSYYGGWLMIDLTCFPNLEHLRLVGRVANVVWLAVAHSSIRCLEIVEWEGTCPAMAFERCATLTFHPLSDAWTTWLFYQQGPFVDTLILDSIPELPALPSNADVLLGNLRHLHVSDQADLEPWLRALPDLHSLTINLQLGDQGRVVRRWPANLRTIRFVYSEEPRSYYELRHSQHFVHWMPWLPRHCTIRVGDHCIFDFERRILV
jgi:hypothetical protein